MTAIASPIYLTFKPAHECCEQAFCHFPLRIMAIACSPLGCFLLDSTSLAHHSCHTALELIFLGSRSGCFLGFVIFLSSKNESDRTPNPRRRSR